MGNYVTCGLGGATVTRRPKTEAAVILPNGEILRLPSPATAAELMFEAPGYFAVSAGEIHVGRRFRPLAAEDELRAGQVYLMLPMKRVNAAATDADVAALWRAAAGEAPVEQDEREEYEEEKLMLPTEFHVPRLTHCRSRKPALETIAEETVLSTR